MRSLFLILACSLAACSGSEPRAEAHSNTAGQSSWTVSPRGIGPLVAGMTVEEARAALGTELTSPADSQCAYIVPEAGPAGVRFMVVGGHVARVEVHDTTVATSAGAHVGDTEARIEALYRGRLEVAPHKYTEGHYLIVSPAAQADSQYRLIFETDKGYVTTYRAGLRPMVGWVEGCS